MNSDDYPNPLPNLAPMLSNFPNVILARMRLRFIGRKIVWPLRIVAGSMANLFKQSKTEPGANMARNNNKLEGFEALMENLKQLEKISTRRAVMRRAIDKAAKPMAEEMRSRAPKAEGDMAKSVKIAGTLNKSQMALWNKENPSKSAVTRFVGPSVSSSQAVAVEYGTAPHENKGKFAGTMHPGTAPQPFARPAFDATADRVWNTLADEMEKEIIKTVKRVNQRKSK